VTRTREQRIAEAKEKLATERNCWLATASPDGAPHLVPVRLDWDGSEVVFTTRSHNVTARNLAASPHAKIAVGLTHDVVLIDAAVSAVFAVGADPQTRSHFVARTGWDPGEGGGDWVFVRLAPRTIQVWGPPSEMADRTVFADGRWLGPGP